MRKILGMVIFLAFMGCLIEGAGEITYTRGNTEAIKGVFTRFYLDTLIQKADSTWRTVTVPDNKIAFNLKIWIPDPHTREESLRVYFKVNSIHGCENADDATLPVIDFGYDNKGDTLYFYGTFSSFSFLSYTNTAGADANDSLFTPTYEFSTDRKASSGFIW